MLDIGLKIKDLRTEQRFSQKELAKKLNVKQNTLSRYENNLVRPAYETLILLAKIFETTTDYLLGLED